MCVGVPCVLVVCVHVFGLFGVLDCWLCIGVCVCVSLPVCLLGCGVLCVCWFMSAWMLASCCVVLCLIVCACWFDRLFCFSVRCDCWCVRAGLVVCVWSHWCVCDCVWLMCVYVVCDCVFAVCVRCCVVCVYVQAHVFACVLFFSVRSCVVCRSVCVCVCLS